MRKRISLVGKTFGMLKVIKPTRLVLNRVRNGYKEMLQEYECLCICGNTKITTCNQLRAVLHGKGTSSCGCAHRKDSERNKWSVCFNIVWKNYVCHAVANNRKFLLKKEIFNLLISGNCFYCGKTPQTIVNSKSKRKPETLLYNGVDRINNSLSYTEDNCVSCCETCNKMKLALKQEEFLRHIKRIYDHSIRSKKFL